ncbi:MAG: DUF1667 domain-containing protein [bacterium]
MEKEMVCINCPVGCRLIVSAEDGKVDSVTGNLCPRGEEYARQEAVDPLRVLTSLMRIEGQERPFSVKSSDPIPKRVLFDCVSEIFAHKAALPIHVGDIIIKNVCNTGKDIISTQEVLN